MVYFTSDLHIGHKNILKYRTEFSSYEAHNSYWIDKIKSLNKRDILFVLGDFLFSSKDYKEHLKELKNIKCRIKLIMGNHDSRDLYKDCIDSKIEMQLPLFSYKNMWLSHCPIHEYELRDRIGNAHGHLHKSVLKTNMPEKYFDVSPEKHNYEFISLDAIKEYFISV